MNVSWKLIAGTALVFLAADLLMKAVEPHVINAFPNLFKAPEGQSPAY